MRPADQVLRAGDPVQAFGRLVRTPAGDWFEPPLPDEGPAWSGGPPVPTPSRYAVAVVGVDFDNIDRRFERDASIEGFATVEAIWLGDQLQVRGQTTDRLWSREELEPVREHLLERWNEWRVFRIVHDLDEHAQPFFTVELVRVTDEVATWADAQPTDLCRLQPWLARSSTDAGSERTL
jgi:hypothetical protein